MFLISRTSVQSSGRSTRLHSWYLSSIFRFKQLISGFQKKKGRSSSTGRRLILSKGTNLYRNVYYRVSSGIGLLITSLIVEYHRSTPKNSILALFCNALGCWFYFLATSAMDIFSYYRIIIVDNIQTSVFFLEWQWPTLLVNFPPHSSVCLLGQSINTYSMFNKLNYKIRFVKAIGSSALVLSTQFFVTWALLIFPSKKFKIINPAVTVANFGVVGLQSAAGIRQTKAGARRLLHGFSPIVRGTVKNANDHPNGGRSRALRCSRTPWGQIAKKSRKPFFLVK